MTSTSTQDLVVEQRLRAAIRAVPDFPKPGILFRDITPLLADHELLARAMRDMTVPFDGAGVTHVAAIESRGFVFGAPIALALSAGLVLIRKPGKLPWRTTRVDYALEYGSDSLEMHADGLPPAARVLVVDDVLATGGTAAATCRLVEQGGGTVVACTFLLELDALRGRERLEGRRTTSLLHF